MEDRQELNFHSETEQHEVRIRDAIMLDGHAIAEALPDPNRVWTSIFTEDPTMMSVYDARIRKNLHHVDQNNVKQEYRPCKVTYPNG